MTRYRGFKEKPSKSELFEPKPILSYKSIESKIKYGTVILGDLNIREAPDGKVLEVVSNGTKLKVEDNADSRWIRVTTPSGVNGFAVSKYIHIDREV